ncbi:hypothetical protein BJ508DRAFT_160717 [Ascobolus immersus RN42]|uniref:Uncharacterized protein n=1 Tax=Ascobolus immersus RN42 TaxID=1160509 RepID=A0A3N4HYA7_ASCIM|nr:hypothetical protein BJ508DRAFT_160717 [Ascobolus immersus RN42]
MMEISPGDVQAGGLKGRIPSSEAEVTEVETEEGFEAQTTTLNNNNNNNNNNDGVCIMPPHELEPSPAPEDIRHGAHTEPAHSFFWNLLFGVMGSLAGFMFVAEEVGRRRRGSRIVAGLIWIVTSSWRLVGCFAGGRLD